MGKTYGLIVAIVLALTAGVIAVSVATHDSPPLNARADASDNPFEALSIKLAEYDRTTSSDWQGLTASQRIAVGGDVLTAILSDLNRKITEDNVRLALAYVGECMNYESENAQRTSLSSLGGTCFRNSAVRSELLKISAF